MNRKTSRLVIIHCIICFMLIALSLPGIVTASSERRIALVIGNGSYSSSPLKNPVNDAADMATNLQRLGFTVTLKKNASHQEMEDAIREFGDQLKKGGVGLFFYAGHGVQIGGRNYLLPIGARINRDTEVKFQAVDTEIVLAEMGNAGNNLNIVILDACRDNPFGRSFRTGSRGLAIISDAPKGTLITYSTSPGKVAADGSGRNSPYTESLIRHIKTPGLPIEEVFKEVRKELGRKTGGQQVPWELSSLEGQFYFSPGKQSSPIISSATDNLSVEQRQIEAERDRLRRERELLEQQESLEEERRILEEKKKKLAVVVRPSVSIANEIRRDGRFIAYDNGTVLDSKTNLMWAAKDNGSNISWAGAKSYCENYSVGGVTGWRMPTQSELAGLYDASNPKYQACHSDDYKIYLTNLIDLSCCCPWASEAISSNAAYFHFGAGERDWGPQSGRNHRAYRALPVRNAK
ncbi:MAG: caspase family protein [Deltaproteobacteria bacterium]|nr:caspase family protein [Deltaproteobacteria bacterium]